MVFLIGSDDLSSALSMDNSLDEDNIDGGRSRDKAIKESALQRELLSGSRAVDLADVKSPEELQAESAILEAIEERERGIIRGSLSFLDRGNNSKSSPKPALLSGVSDEVASSVVLEAAAKEHPRKSSSLGVGNVPEEKEVTFTPYSNTMSLLDATASLQQMQSNYVSRRRSIVSGNVPSEVFNDDNKPLMKKDFSKINLTGSEDSKDVEQDVESQVKSNHDAARRGKSNWAKVNAYVRMTPKPPMATVEEKVVEEEVVEKDEDEEKAEHHQIYNDALTRVNTLFAGTNGFFHRLKAVSGEKRFFQRVGSYLKKLVLYIILPCLGFSFLSFYVSGNPRISFLSGKPSWSWGFLFIIRQSLTYTLARATEIVLIDFITLQTRLILWMAGPIVTVQLAQSKGWPLQFAIWGLYDTILLSGSHPFANHWLYYQSFFSIFNEENHSGTLLASEGYHGILTVSIFGGIAVTLKDVWFRSIMGKRNYVKYGERMTRMMRKMRLMSEVAKLAGVVEESAYDKDSQLYKILSKQKSSKSKFTSGKIDKDDNDPNYDEHTDGESSGSFKNDDDDESEIVKKIDERSEKFFNETMSKSQRTNQLVALMGAWEEPELRGKMTEKTTISEMLGFRYALEFILQTKYPFSREFGLADTRLHCAESAQKVYKRLHLNNPESEVLKFDTVCKSLVSSSTEKDKIDDAKAKELIRLFRPDRDGSLLMIDFIRSYDKVYKQLKMISASIENSSKIDHHIQTMCNMVFYLVLFVALVVVSGGDPINAITPVTGLLLPFSFLFSSACSKVFEGALLIIVRQPYDVGDRIATSPAANDTKPGGSTTWFVEGVGLHTTTTRNAATNEVATYSNSSLADLRIINANRSPKAIVFLDFKFGVDASHDKRKLFQTVVEKFVKSRPREWFALLGLRATSVEADRGFINYIIIVQHRDSWQNMGAISTSKAELASYCLEVTKKLDMRFMAPPMPITLSMKNDKDADVQKDFQKAFMEKDFFAM